MEYGRNFSEHNVFFLASDFFGSKKAIVRNPLHGEVIAYKCNWITQLKIFVTSSNMTLYVMTFSFLSFHFIIT